ncbi:hypothetical protein DAPPUDRAFT_235901 [Daphnia pulex]|uniref:Uncharacterized protein n=1 Tax=Daphnia pulex TaxID=6669 RepID=E9FZC7_DAPPU|nr:hypothetical protein DAPPUDRAFT_235901 [Daphnia pulex]|eukprot:EFX87030.1 hypothetical protein DAPPUDRAFT_235901 [Daphnia pulex]
MNPNYLFVIAASANNFINVGTTTIKDVYPRNNMNNLWVAEATAAMKNWGS